MGFIIGLLTVFLVLDCIVLVFLVLIQLPKKEAGAGLAFGGAASDALFGAGSGNVLTKITRYAATIFFVMAILLSFIESHFRSGSATRFEKSLSESAPVSALPPSSAPAARPTIPSTNLTGMPPAESTNLPVPTAATNK